jgi:hypothetical protein
MKWQRGVACVVDGLPLFGDGVRLLARLGENQLGR